MKTVGVLLAAGKSRRFGEADKLLAPFQGRPLFQHAAEAMRSSDVDARIACVANPALQEHFPDFQIALVDGAQSDSLKAGLRLAMDLGADRVLIALADMPNISADILNQLLATEDPLATCRVIGGPITVPALISSAHFPDVMALQGDQGARRLFNAASKLGEVLISAQDAMDIDTPSDLADAGGDTIQSL